ncbi:cilia- and flagella-associated protein 57 [Neocloeon triangulifer]|uniref:cilia- and flagella-associated protein 57 n=1 Tax=Neocloeon triangulifer TaxID=2078957 RepID=UPI00286F6F43|nr:cilia- and flagella-associated protein 57 [Neocloeon triangulifer]
MVIQHNLALKPNFIYGLKSSTALNVNFASNEDVIYPAGGVLVLHSLQNPRNQKYIHLHNKLKPLNVLCISPNKELVACAEGGGNPQVSLYSTTSLQYIASLEIPNENNARDIACIQFSCDGQLLTVITGEPDWMLLCFNVASRALDSKTRANMAAQPNVPVKQVACNPSDAATLALVGPDLFRLLQLVDGSWRQFGFYKAQSYPLSSVAWLTSDRILAGTDDGRLLLIESNELRAVFRAYGLQTVALPPKNENWEENIPKPSNENVTSIVSFRKGFLVGFGNPCQVTRFTLEEGQKYHLKTTYRPQENSASAVWALAASPDCSVLVCTSKESQFFRAQVSSVGENEKLQPFGEHLHQGPVVSLSVCVWRPIFVTCGALDGTVRVWNYETGMQELLRKFDSPPVSVSIHPLGLYVLVLFKECVCLMSIELDDLRMIRTAAAADCYEVQFSPGGDLFAVVYGNKVDIVSIVSFVSKLSLLGHRAKVESIAWSQDGTRLVTCGADGAVYTWDSASGARLEELVTKGCHFLGVSTISSGKTNFLTKGDEIVQVVSENQVERVVQGPEGKIAVELTVTSVTRNDKTLLVGSRCGSLIAYALPFNDDELVSAFCCIHSAPVTKIVSSYDCTILFSCSEDGSICIWNLEDNRAERSEAPIVSVEKVLIGRRNLRDLSELNKSLSSRLKYLQTEKEDTLKYQEMIFGKTTAEISELRDRDVAEMRREMELMTNKHAEELREKTRRFELVLSEHETTVAKMDNAYHEKLIVQYKKVEQLQNELMQQENHYKENQEVIMEFEQRIEGLLAEVEQLKGTVSSLEQFIEEQKKLMARNNIIMGNKEKELMSTKRQVEELEKDKANVSLHLDLMTRHIEPKDAAIREKIQEIEQVEKLTNELKVERSWRAQLEIDKFNLQNQIKQNQKQAIWEKTKHRDTLRDMQRIRARVHELGAALQRPRRLAELASELYQDYGRQKDPLQDEHPVEVLLEMKRQVETLQTLNASLVEKLRAQDDLHRSEKNALKKECISLMKQLTKAQQETNDARAAKVAAEEQAKEKE